MHPLRMTTFVLVVLWATGCVTSVPKLQTCEDNDECRSTFGAGHVCGDEGYCTPLVLPPRCSTTYPSDLFEGDRYTNTIVFGSMFDHALASQTGRLKAMQLAELGANDFGGLDNAIFGAVHCDLTSGAGIEAANRLYADGLNQSDAAMEVAEFLVTDLGVPAILGPSASNDVIGTFTDIVEGSGTLMISPAGTSSAVGPLEVGPFSDLAPGMLWRTSASDAILGAATAQDMLARGVDEIVIIAVQGYGTTLGTAIQGAFVQGGGSTANLISYEDSNDSDRRSRIIQAGENYPNADEFVFVSSITQDMSDFIEIASTNNGYQDRSVFLSVAAANIDFINSSPPDFFGNFAAQPEADPPQYRFRTVRYATPEGNTYNNFISLYAGTFNEDPSGLSFTAHAYDATWMLMYGSAWSVQSEGRVSGLGIARGLRRLSAGGTLEVGPATWEVARESMLAGLGVDIIGASGALDYDPETEETIAPAEVLAVVRDPVDGGWTFERTFTFP